jgi:hypothetical protein
VQGGKELVAIGVASCDQAGPRHAATSPTRRCRVRRLMAGRPSRWWADRWTRLWAGGAAGGSAGRAWGSPAVAAAAGPVGQGGSAVVVVAVDPAAHSRGIVAQQVGDLGRCEALLGRQDHDQAAADTVGAVQQAQQVAGVGGGAGGVGVHAGGTHTGGGLVWLSGVWKLQRPARLPHRWSARSQLGLRAKLLVSCLAGTRFGGAHGGSRSGTGAGQPSGS